MENDNKRYGYVLSGELACYDKDNNRLDNYSTYPVPLLIFDSKSEAKAFLKDYKYDYTQTPNCFTEELIGDDLFGLGSHRTFRAIRKDINTGEFRMFVEHVYRIYRTEYHQIGT